MKLPLSLESQRLNYLGLLIIHLCPTVCDPTDCSPPGSSVHGILQARTLEWAAIPFSRGSSQPMDRTQVSCTTGKILYYLNHQGSPPGLKYTI